MSIDNTLDKSPCVLISISLTCSSSGSHAVAVFVVVKQVVQNYCDIKRVLPSQRSYEVNPNCP